MLSPIEENKLAKLCLSPHEKLRSRALSRNKRSHIVDVTGDAKKARLENKFTDELDPDHGGWISDDYLRAMDFDDRLSQDIDWVSHEEMEVSIDHTTSDDVNDLSFGPSFSRNSSSFDDPAEISSIFVDYIRMESNNTQDAEKLLMSFDTMCFKIPSPTSASGRKRTSIFSDTDVNIDQSVPKLGTQAEVRKVTDSQPSFSPVVHEPSTDQLASTNAPTVPFFKPEALLSKPKSTNKYIGSYSPEARKLRLQRFHEKRKNRTWKKSIKYDCRKKLADDRPRVKGRFVRVLESVGDVNDNATSTGVLHVSSIDMGVQASIKKPQISVMPRVDAAFASPGLEHHTPTSTQATAEAALFTRMIASV